MPESIDEDCPNCGPDGDMIRAGPMVGCSECSGMWAPEQVVETTAAMERSDR
jgi:uncharacterized Zn finger protein